MKLDKKTVPTEECTESKMGQKIYSGEKNDGKAAKM